MSESMEPRAKRQKKDKFGRLAAFEKLKNLKGKGSKHKYEINEIDNVYETVDEKEYTKKVLSRQDDDWIVDDDGSGYVEDGRDIFDDDLDSESLAVASALAKDKGTKKKKKSVSANAGKGNLQFMLSNMPTKKKEEVKLEDDDVLSELINEIDNSDSLPITPALNQPLIKPQLATSFNVLAEKQAAKNYMKSFTTPKPKVFTATNKENHSQNVPHKEAPSTPENKDITNTEIDIDDQKTQEESEMLAELNFENDRETDLEATDMFDDDFDIAEIDDVELEQKTFFEDEDFPIMINGEFLPEIKPMQEKVTNVAEKQIQLDAMQSLLTVNGKGEKVLRFFWWDAVEGTRGVISFFGRTFCQKSQTYVSCCVVVKNIDRKIYLLPRTHYLDKHNNETDKPVSLMDVYHEFNNETARKLRLTAFKSRKVTKNYAFSAEVPSESEYLEIQYSADYPALDVDAMGRTYSRVFGTDTSFLELLLLDRKIKGPCWLDVINPELVYNPVSWCKYEIDCMKPANITVSVSEKPIPPPPLVTLALNMRTAVNKKAYRNEIVMISCLVHTKYSVDKHAPDPPFERHFCVLTNPGEQPFPLGIHNALQGFKATRVQKVDTERALLNFFVAQIAKIDPDLIVGHDLDGYQINLLCNSILRCRIQNSSQISRLKFDPSVYTFSKMLFRGRLVCDLKISAKELIKARSYDLQTLCENILNLKENQRIELEIDDIPKMYATSEDLLKLISLTMRDTAYILKMMYELNVIPLALQITNIAGYIMSKTLMGGRSGRNEYLLLHAFSEKNYIVPDRFKKKEISVEKIKSRSSRKKPTYSGGLVLEPKVGFYDTLILLMDFNSLYPSIIQEYNICFTTIPPVSEEDDTEYDLVLPDQNLPPGILPTEIRKLVESRREVKKLMNNPDISPELKMQYNIRQIALKLTANSMYGCLGFSNSRFFAKNLAALVTLKGREILVNTKDLVQKLTYEVIYGDTDSIMINTKIQDYDQVFKIGNKIKQEVNRLYKQVELDIDGVFKYLLLLKKKKYAAVTLTKAKNGELQMKTDLKGLDIVRRDWSQLAVEAGKVVLNHIFSDQEHDNRINNICNHLTKLKEDLEQNKVPLSLLVITKQLTKEPNLYPNKNSLPHVQVALRYNKKAGKPLRAGDTVPYIICEDSTKSSAMQRAYHVDELKNSKTLKIDVKYYLSQQIHSVISRLCEPIEGIDAHQIALHLGLDATEYKKSKPANIPVVGENIKRPEVKFGNAEPFQFTCLSCKEVNSVKSPFIANIPFLARCDNQQCKIRPIDYLISIQNQLTCLYLKYIEQYYLYELTCEDPMCPNDTVRLPVRCAGKYPICTTCEEGVLYQKYTEYDLYTQLSFFQYIFDLSKHSSKPVMEQQVERGYFILKENVDKFLKYCEYAVFNFAEYQFYFVREGTTFEYALDDLDDEV